MARRIVLTSGKGGVGKTTVTANLGVQLAKNGCRVVVCDLDFGLNNVDVVLGVENLASFDVIDAIEGRCRPKQALVRHPRYDGGQLFRELRDAHIYVRHWDDERIGQYLRITVGTDEEMEILLKFLKERLSQ